MKKYRIVQNNVILHECLDKEEAIETLNILSNIEPDLVIEEYDLPRVTGLGRDPDLH